MVSANEHRNVEIALDIDSSPNLASIDDKFWMEAVCLLLLDLDVKPHTRRDGQISPHELCMDSDKPDLSHINELGSPVFFQKNTDGKIETERRKRHISQTPC
eukprot:CFRG6114T1